MAAVTVVAALVAACGSNNKSGPPATTVARGSSASGATTTTAGLAKPACELLTRDDIANALGNPVKDPQPAGPTDCSWGTDVDGGTSLGLTVAKPGPQGGAQECAAQRNTLPEGLPREPVPGVGTSAVWVLEPLTTLKQGHLVACWNDSVVVILLTGEHEPAALRATAVSLAQQVHSRL